MKIAFDDAGKNFIEVQKAEENSVVIVLSSQDSRKLNTTIVNSVEISRDDFIKLLSDLGTFSFS